MSGAKTHHRSYGMQEKDCIGRGAIYEEEARVKASVDEIEERMPE